MPHPKAINYQCPKGIGLILRTMLPEAFVWIQTPPHFRQNSVIPCRIPSSYLNSMKTCSEEGAEKVVVGLAGATIPTGRSSGVEAGSLLDAFESWMAAEQERVFLLCLRILKNQDDADSAAQDTFLKAHHALAGRRLLHLEEPSRWLGRIAVNTCLDILRSRRWRFWRSRAGPEETETVLETAQASQASPEEVLVQRQVALRLSRAVGRLSLRQRTVFVLRHEEDCSFEEIGELLGLDVGTVKSHMARAILKLKTELRDLYGRPSLEQ
jgi:RNA polymerase sigma-70 factor, ECF subfamily